MKANRKSGNILFLILITVALFAGLSYVVTQSTRSGAGVSTEKAALCAAEVLNLTSSLRAHAQRLMAQGCEANQLEFHTTIFTRNNGAILSTPNPNTPADGRCNIWDGKYGIPARPISKDCVLANPGAATNWVPGHMKGELANHVGVGTDANDIRLNISDLTRDVCLFLIKKLGIPLDDIPTADSGTGSGTWRVDENLVLLPFGDEVPELAGRNEMPISSPSQGTGRCSFMAVLIPK